MMKIHHGIAGHDGRRDGQSMQQLRQAAAGGEGRCARPRSQEMGSGISANGKYAKPRRDVVQEYKMGMVRGEAAAAAAPADKQASDRRLRSNTS
jgi:hypothetical protein